MPRCRFGGSGTLVVVSLNRYAGALWQGASTRDAVSIVRSMSSGEMSQ
jgi:hypothetical protein